MMNKENCKGYSLIQLIFVIAIIGILTSIAYPSYQKYLRDSEIRQALAALVESAQFMERFYQQNGSFKKTSTAWPDLPNSRSLENFCIYPHGLARGALDGKFTLKAVALDKNKEPRVIKINESLTTLFVKVLLVLVMMLRKTIFLVQIKTVPYIGFKRVCEVITEWFIYLFKLILIK